MKDFCCLDLKWSLMFMFSFTSSLLDLYLSLNLFEFIFDPLHVMNAIGNMDEVRFPNIKNIINNI